MTAWTCPEVEERLDLLAAGECDAEARRMVEDHLESCPACTARYAESRQLMGLLASQLDTAGPLRLRQRLAKKELQNRRRQVLRFVGRAAGLAAMLVLSAGLLLMPSGPARLGDALQLSLAVQPAVRDAIPAPPSDHEMAFKSMVLEMRGPSGQMGQDFRRELRSGQQDGRLPPPPDLAVHLELTLKNTARQPIEVQLGNSASDLRIDADGPGVVRVPAPGAAVPNFLRDRTLRLEPGKAESLVIDRLIDGRPGALEYIYLTEPGEYELKLVLNAKAGGQEARLSSPAVRLNLKNPS